MCVVVNCVTSTIKIICILNRSKPCGLKQIVTVLLHYGVGSSTRTDCSVRGWSLTLVCARSLLNSNQRSSAFYRAVLFVLFATLFDFI